MSLVTLTSDLGLRDAYVPILRASLIRIQPNIRIEDITHQVPQFDMFKAADIVKSCFRYFPEGSLHLIAMAPEPAETHPIVVISAEGHYFAGSNSGMLSFIHPEPDWAMLPVGFAKPSGTFPFLSVFEHIFTHWSKGSIRSCGTPIDKIVIKKALSSYTLENQLVGYITHIDHFGNAITNISLSQFQEAKQGRGFTIEFNTYETNEIAEHYSDTILGEQVVLFNSSGWLEIAQNQGNAEKLMGLSRNDKVTIRFKHA